MWTGTEPGVRFGGASSGDKEESVGPRTESLAGHLHWGSGLHKDPGGRIVSLWSGCRHEEGLTGPTDVR